MVFSWESGGVSVCPSKVRKRVERDLGKIVRGETSVRATHTLHSEHRKTHSFTHKIQTYTHKSNIRCA